MALGGVFPPVVEPELVGPGLIQEGLEVAAEAFQLLEFLLHEAVHRFHVAVVSGAAGWVEAVPAAAVFPLDQAGEGRGGAAAVPGAALGHDAGGELEAGQPEGDQLAVAGQIREVFDVHLKKARMVGRMPWLRALSTIW